MWGLSNISKICLWEIQEFLRFLSPPIPGSSSAFLKSEHLCHSPQGSARSSAAQPLISPPLPLWRHVHHPPSPCILLLVNRIPETSLTAGHLPFPIYVNFFLLRVSLPSLGETEYWQESSLFPTVCHWLFLREKEKGEPDTFPQEPGSPLVTRNNTSTGWLFCHFLSIRIHPVLCLQALSSPYFPGGCGELTGMLSEIRRNRQCCCSVAKLCPTLCDPMDGRTPDFPVLHYHLEFAQQAVSSLQTGHWRSFHKAWERWKWHHRFVFCIKTKQKQIPDVISLMS